MLRTIISYVFSFLLVISPIVGQFIYQNSELPEQHPAVAVESTLFDNSYLNADQIKNSPTPVAEGYLSAIGSNPAVSGYEPVMPQELGDRTEEPLQNAQDNNKSPILQSGPANNPAAASSQTSAGKPDELQTTQKPQNNDKVQPTKAPETVSTPKPSTTLKPTVPEKPAETAKPAETPKPTVRPTEPPKPTGTPKPTVSPKPAETVKPTESPKATAKPTESPKPTEKPKETPQPASSPKPAEESNPKPQNPAPSSEEVFDTSKVSSGTLGVRYLNTSGKRVKLMIEKGETRYTYNLAGDGSLETFPLQSGDGEYTVSIMQNTEGNKYVYVLTKKINVKIGNSNSTYLGSIQMINWNKNMAAIKKAAELTSGVSGDEEKVKKIYNYVVKNIRYDYDKLNNLPSTYIPVIDNTYNSKSGICYDFASLFAAMLRSVGIPAKLVMGYADGVNGYHAWNEVYYDGKWRVIDTSYDSQMRENGFSYSMVKSKSKYQAKKVY
ncbi:MAG TPA: hypothetical protein GX505_03575 [Clostridiales bacterium]|nr:hypothetical protein [Clostridiales bacterium]